MRANLPRARDLLREAGYRVVGGRLVDPKSGQPVRLNLPAYSPLLINQVSLFICNAQLGVEIGFRSVDAAQMRHLSRHYDYDLLYYSQGVRALADAGRGDGAALPSKAAETPRPAQPRGHQGTRRSTTRSRRK